MAGRYRTLREALTQQKPVVECSILTKMKNTRGKWPDLQDAVTIWGDFNLDNLNDGYGHILDRAHELQVPQPDQGLANMAVNDPKDVSHLISWNFDMMEVTLRHTESQCNLHPGVVLRHNHTNADRTSVAAIPNAPPNTAVDHIIELDGSPASILVVGFGRPTCKWSGRKLGNLLNKQAHENVLPLEQLANSCELAKTRYGYIQTDEDLVVCRFSREGMEWKAAIQLIPWAQYGTSKLTSDLALWWLTMLAMSAPNNREIVAESDMIPIHAWEHFFSVEDRGWIRRHHYSMHVKPASPPSSPVCFQVAPNEVAGVTANTNDSPNDHSFFSGSDEWEMDLA